MSELWYILNHWITIVWLCLAALYAYYAVIADLVVIVRNRNREQDQGRPTT